MLAAATRRNRRLSGHPELDNEESISSAQLFGVAAYFAAALNAMIALRTVLALGPDEPLFGRCLTFVEHGLLLSLQQVQEKCQESRLRFSPEEIFFLNLFCTELLPCLKSSQPHYARILAAWRDVEQSGLLQRVPFATCCERNAHATKSLADAQAAKDAGVPLRVCALPSCGAREAHFKKCSACGQVVYCSKQHQTEHWPAHKAACKAARNAAKPGGGAGRSTAS